MSPAVQQWCNNSFLWIAWPYTLVDIRSLVPMRAQRVWSYVWTSECVTLICCVVANIDRPRFTGQMSSVALFSGSLSRAEVLEVYAVMVSPSSVLVAPTTSDRSSGAGGSDTAPAAANSAPLSTPFSVLHALITGSDSASGR